MMRRKQVETKGNSRERRQEAQERRRKSEQEVTGGNIRSRRRQ